MQQVLSRCLRSVCAAAVATVLSACGGGGGDTATSSDGSPSATPAQAEKPTSRDAAARFLTQATFGPTDADIERVQAIGYAAWIDEQFALPATSHRASWEAADARLKALGDNAWQDEVFDSFWTQALTGPDQLRQRVAFALSQIFVISMVDDNVGNNSRAAADWLDLMGTMPRYRVLLESVARHPMMGVYLSHLKNQKADPKTGRVPDENFAREVMQLFSIGLVPLNTDGTARSGETYTSADIGGLARVFTGWSWSCADWPNNDCFHWGSANGNDDPDQSFKPMLGYPQYHSTEAKSFLGTTIAAQSQSDPAASLKQALDTLAAHPNVGPFIGRQIIQRLVTSNPSPAYVAAVSGAFNGSGGDLKATVKAVLMHPEARQPGNGAGKVREPVLRLSAFLRAFPHTSDTGAWRVGNTDSVSTALGQSPLRAPSVFNFYRPGYVPPGTASAAAGLVAPELQIAHESSVAGYVNFMRDAVSYGVGQWNGVVNGVARNRRDLQGNFSAELALADRPAELVDRVLSRLTWGSASAALRTEIVDAVSSITLPALNSSGSNQPQIDSARRARVNVALLLTLASPEFGVQK